MSLPNEPDFVVVSLGSTGGSPTYTVICGIETITLNQTVNSADRFRRDCAKPAALPTRKVRVSSKQWDVTGSGVINMDEFDTFEDALGISRLYKIDFGKRDGTDTGEIIGSYTGTAVMTAANISMGADEGTGDITLAGEGEITWALAA